MDKIHNLSMKKKCISKKGVIFYHKSSSVDNLQKDNSAIQVGKNCHIKGKLLVFANGGCIRIGNDGYLGENSRIWSMSSIAIGDRVLISYGVNIHDSDSHSLSAKHRYEHFKEIVTYGHPQGLCDVKSLPIEIGNDVWIGFNASIMKGVKIGQGAIIGSNAVIIKDIPEYGIAVGNPAKIIGYARP
jgi:maltose O-acetyltransferase